MDLCFLEKNSFFLKSSKHKKRKPEDFDNSKSKIRSGFYLLSFFQKIN